MGFTGRSAGQESTCNAGNPGSIPESGRFLEWDRLPTPVFLGFSGGSNGKQSTCNVGVRSLGWEDPLEGGMATHSSILAWRISVDRGALRATVHRIAKSWIQLK